VYNKVNAAIVKALQDIAGEKNVLVDVEALEPYTHDEVVGLRADPEVAVRVTSAEQVAAIFKLAQRERVLRPQRRSRARPRRHRPFDGKDESRPGD
jgi:hypothetical protein